jgi:hypothetical protein
VGEREGQKQMSKLNRIAVATGTAALVAVAAIASTTGTALAGVVWGF